MAKRARLAHDGWRGIHDDDPICVAPHGKVGAAVAGVVEALVSVAVHKLLRLSFALEIVHAVGSNDVVEETEMISDGARRPLVSSRCKNDFAPIALLLAQELDQFGIERQNFRSQSCAYANLLLEGRSARGQQSRQLANSIAVREQR